MAYNPFRLQPNDPLFWMEDVIEKEMGLVTPEHDAEHAAMFDHWGIKYVNSGPLNGQLRLENKSDGSVRYYYTNDRPYHLTLHIKYWKEVGMRPEYVKRYEENIGSLDDVPLPEVHPDDPKGK